MSRFARLAALASVALLVFAPSVAGALLIDDFSDATLPSLTSDAGGLPVSQVDAGLTNVLGGQRTTSIETVSQDVPGFDTSTVTFFENGGGLSFADVESRTGWRGTVALEYDLSGLPSVLDGTTAIEILFLGYDQPASQAMPVDVRLDGAVVGSAFATGGPQSLVVAFGAPAMGDYDTLTISFEAPKGADFRITTIESVPEPRSAVLLGMASLLWLLRRHA